MRYKKEEKNEKISSVFLDGRCRCRRADIPPTQMYLPQPTLLTSHLVFDNKKCFFFAALQKYDSNDTQPKIISTCFAGCCIMKFLDRVHRNRFAMNEYHKLIFWIRACRFLIREFEWNTKRKKSLTSSLEHRYAAVFNTVRKAMNHHPYFQPLAPCNYTRS